MAKAKDRTPAREYTRRAREYYKRDDLTKVLRLCARAYRLAPKDPYVIWDYASVLEESGHEREALKLFRRLLARKPERLICVADGRDREWVRGIRNDCRLMIGFCYFELHRSSLAEKWLRDYLRHLGPHTPSLYERSVATQALESLANYRRIDRFMDEGRLARAKSLIQRELKKRPDDFYWLACLAFIYCEGGARNSALTTIRKALALAPREPLVMFYHAYILRSLSRHAEAMDVLRRILRKGERRIGRVETREGIRWARSLMNDCRFEMALSLVATKDFQAADRWLKLYLKGRKPGIYSWYEAEEVAAQKRLVTGAQ
jgi:tetratricopeptide (TPR) repeat protein